MESLLDHVFITVRDLDRSIAFYETALKPLGIVHALDYITIPVITLRTFSIPTVTVSKRSTRAGNTANHRASKFQRAATCADARIVTRRPMTGKLII